MPTDELFIGLNNIILILLYGFFILFFFIFTMFIASLLFIEAEERIYKVKLAFLLKKKTSILKIIFNILAALIYGTLSFTIMMLILYYVLNVVSSI